MPVRQSRPDAMLEAGAPDAANDGSNKRLVERRHLGHGFNTSAVKCVLAHGPTKDFELVVLLGKVLNHFGRCHRVF